MCKTMKVARVLLCVLMLFAASAIDVSCKMSPAAKERVASAKEESRHLRASDVRDLGCGRYQIDNLRYKDRPLDEFEKMHPDRQVVDVQLVGYEYRAAASFYEGVLVTTRARSAEQVPLQTPSPDK